MKSPLLLVFTLIILQLSCTGGKSISGEKTKIPTTIQHSEFEDENEYYSDKHINYSNQDFDENIKTIKIFREGSPLTFPIISLEKGERLTLKFDDLSQNPRDFYYTFEHCTHDWQKSDINEMDYMQGFLYDQINNYEFSFNTVINFTHYSFSFPNDNISLTRSGNYIIRVYADGDRDNVMFTRRFMIYENKSNIEADIKPSSVVSDRDYRQEVDFSVNLAALQVSNPYRDIEVLVMQNYSWNFTKGGVKPNFIKDQQLEYNFQKEFTFDGGNEFRFFDAKSLRYQTEEISRIEFEKDAYHIYLTPDMPRPYAHYSFTNDLNGLFLVKNDEMSNADLESDYVYVHYFLNQTSPLINGDIYVYGQLSDYTFKKDFKMIFDAENQHYKLKILQKQGYYNYQYIFSPNKGEADISRIEGNHFDTDNVYMIFVYFKDPSTFSDRLVGYREINTIKR